MPRQAAQPTNSPPPILHPFLLALYPVLALLAVNAFEIQFSDGLRALITAPLLASVFVLFARLVANNWHRAGLVASFWLVLFFSYGHAYNLLGDTLIGRHRVLLPTCVMVLIAGSYWILKRIEHPARSTYPANILGGLLVLFSLGQIAMAKINMANAREEFPPGEFLQLQVSSGRPPDIYYIIVDGYARKDALAEDIHFDNSEFLTQMKALGFYVASCSQSNYAQTKLSLSSALNMNYVEDYYPDLDPARIESHGLEPFLAHSSVRRALESLGYVTVAFETGFDWTELRDADHYLGQDIGRDGGPNAFEVLLLRSTAVLALTDAAATLPEFLSIDLSNADLIHRERVNFILETLPDLPPIEAPKFVFAHVVSPHPPYVFDREGNFPDPNTNETALYRDQVAYLNSRLVDIVAKIISETKTPPVIIVQGDHGSPVSSDRGRMQILNLYLIPQNGEVNLYPKITPINTFRIIFNSLFETHLPLLEDKSYFSQYQHPFDFQMIPNDDPDCMTS
ncbi:MAG: hypothetical protein ACRDFQ_06380 [Anaerolineales bacterium]